MLRSSCHTWAVCFKSSVKEGAAPQPSSDGPALAVDRGAPPWAWSLPQVLDHRREPHPPPHWPGLPLIRTVTGKAGCNIWGSPRPFSLPASTAKL